MVDVFHLRRDIFHSNKSRRKNDTSWFRSAHDGGRVVMRKGRYTYMETVYDILTKMFRVINHDLRNDVLELLALDSKKLAKELRKDIANRDARRVIPRLLSKHSIHNYERDFFKVVNRHRTLIAMLVRGAAECTQWCRNLEEIVHKASLRTGDYGDAILDNTQKHIQLLISELSYIQGIGTGRIVYNRLESFRLRVKEFSDLGSDFAEPHKKKQFAFNLTHQNESEKKILDEDIPAIEIVLSELHKHILKASHLVTEIRRILKSGDMG